MKISERARNTAPSPTLAITAKAKQLKEEGVDVLSFGAGEPDFDTPEPIADAAIEAIRTGFTRYTPSAGILPLRQAICDKLHRENGLYYTPSQVIVTAGAKHALFGVFQAIIDPGDEVIIPAPYWVSYPEMVKLAGGVPVTVNAGPDTGYVPDPADIAAAVTPKTRAIVVNSPNNPSGAVFPEAVLKAIADIAIDHQIAIISDEIYEKLVYGSHRHVSIASFSDEAHKLTITINGMSKAFAMTGWRVGYAAGDATVIGAMVRMQDQSTSNITSFVQKGALAALQMPEEPIQKMVAAFAERREAIVAGLNAIPGIRCPEPGGAFYVFPDVSALYGKRAGDRILTTSDDVASWLLDTVQVAVVPGSGFGADANIRLSYACSLQQIQRGIDRIAQAVSSLA